MCLREIQLFILCILGEDRVQLRFPKASWTTNTNVFLHRMQNRIGVSQQSCLIYIDIWIHSFLKLTAIRIQINPHTKALQFFVVNLNCTLSSPKIQSIKSWISLMNIPRTKHSDEPKTVIMFSKCLHDYFVSSPSCLSHVPERNSASSNLLLSGFK